MLTVVIRRRLEKRFRCSLPTTLLWRQPTVAAVSDYIAGLVSPTASTPLLVAAPIPALRGSSLR
ncbi:hypothetical protein GCM10022419_119530 [Nonomuraea rosea]|uniref:Carrier domain-containing protein n=1 Tax=Nonomuraea rosea TaxID=638574 RepID=A0ABP6ZRD9_9ACTN